MAAVTTQHKTEVNAQDASEKVEGDSQTTLHDQEKSDDEPDANTFFCRTLYDYQNTDPYSLCFRKGDVVEVLSRLDSGWWDGLLGDQRGWFPSNHVTVITDDEAEALYQGPSRDVAQSSLPADSDVDDSTPGALPQSDRDQHNIGASASSSATEGEISTLEESEGHHRDTTGGVTGGSLTQTSRVGQSREASNNAAPAPPMAQLVRARKLRTTHPRRRRPVLAARALPRPRRFAEMQLPSIPSL